MNFDKPTRLALRGLLERARGQLEPPIRIGSIAAALEEAGEVELRSPVGELACLALVGALDARMLSYASRVHPLAALMEWEGAEDRDHGGVLAAFDRAIEAFT